jgi:GNAT superfamily N-acetyltransferase
VVAGPIGATTTPRPSGGPLLEKEGKGLVSPPSEPLREHALNASHVPQCLALSAEAGWNQIEADWRLMLRLGRGLGASDGDRLVATTIMLPFERRFAWISMVLVDERFRRRGLATRLMRRAVDALTGMGCVLLLDATPAGREVYQRLGFADCWGMARLACAGAVSPDAARGDSSVRRLVPDDWARVLEIDRTVFGADRSGILRDLANRVPQAALVAECDGRICGASFARDGRLATQLGPVIAPDDPAARALVTRALTEIAGPVFIDVPDRHATIGAWLRALGFASQRPLIRMAHGRSEAFDDPRRLYAVAGPELG